MPGEEINGTLYKSQLGYSHVVLVEKPMTPVLEEEESQSFLSKAFKYVHPDPLKYANEGEVLFYLRNGALADSTIFGEYFPAFESDGDPFVLTHEAALD